MVAEWLWSGCGVVAEWLRGGCGVVAEWSRVVAEWLWSGYGVFLSHKIKVNKMTVFCCVITFSHPTYELFQRIFN